MNSKLSQLPETKKRWLKRGLMAAVALAILGPLLALTVAASGIIPIAASSGHWKITEWMLHFSMRRSVATHSLAIKVPDDLDDPALVMRGAGHYEHGCRFCHAAPGSRLPRVPHAMLPYPPRLGEPARELDPEDLFYIIKHGIKFAGMPMWPAKHRDDEVWAVVAFMRTLPELDAAGYHRLVWGDEQPPVGSNVPEVVARMCVRCHGTDGQGRVPGAFPRLAGQSEAYLFASLQAYAEGHRPSGIMEPLAAALDEQQMRAAAEYFAALPPMRSEPSAVAASTTAGAQIAAVGIPEQRIPACKQCHGPNPVPRNEAYPKLAGQDARYLREQLELFRSGHRGGTRYAELMDPVASHDLTPEQISAVVHYYAALGGE